MKIHLRNDQRVVIVGGTGTGKTVLAEHFLARLNRVLVVDPKHEFRLDGFKVRKTLPMLGSKWRIIYRPRSDDDSDLAALFGLVYKLKNVTIYVDELATLADTFPQSTKKLADIARTGRSRRVSVWTALQRPRFVPRVFFTEAESMFIFNLRGEDDRAYMSKFSDPLVEDQIERYTFWYYHPDHDGVALMRYNPAKRYIEKIG